MHCINTGSPLRVFFDKIGRVSPSVCIDINNKKGKVSCTRYKYQNKKGKTKI
jgi:major membrane immunogen (membrane-anchored lipoprotein)